MKFDLLRTNVMIDDETLSTRFNAGILSIGAVKFNYAGVQDEFYVNVKLSSLKKYGLHIDTDTLKWWNEQHPGAIEALFKNSVTLEVAMQKFNDWYGKESLTTWSNGTDFDQVINRNAYDVTGIKCPWDFRDGMCYRTMKNVFNDKSLWPPDDAKGTKHNALDDAKFQAQHLQNIWHYWMS